MILAELNQEENGNYKCPFCNKEYCKKGILTHIWRKHEDGINHDPNIGYLNKDRKQIWNKGLTKDTNNSVKQMALTLKNRYNSGELIASFKGRKHSSQTKEKISKKMSINNKGGRCKWFSYIKLNGEEVKVQGTWELRFAKVLDKIDKNWIKPKLSNKHTFEWIDDNNIKHNYTPDFYSQKLNKYFEIKGFWWNNDKLKMQKVIEQHSNINIEIVLQKELLEYENQYN